ncbi:hypothetical protein SAMN05444372_107189 [Flavobacterium micromati]|uniref:Uncharacterized protein n=1 Tax=Flavobacterium micromati TaxID=229205 RepID=A0A1M5L4Q8_9FLAO|nr:hypothetical protein [Flavobacterium micromati]SHG59403.1 hypothetical protein SAMN05444372_107189 [Flavobacterium micromati]
MFNLPCYKAGYKKLKNEFRKLNLVELNAQEVKEVEGEVDPSLLVFFVNGIAAVVSSGITK